MKTRLLVLVGVVRALIGSPAIHGTTFGSVQTKHKRRDVALRRLYASSERAAIKNVQLAAV